MHVILLPILTNISQYIRAMNTPEEKIINDQKKFIRHLKSKNADLRYELKKLQEKYDQLANLAKLAFDVANSRV